MPNQHIEKVYYPTLDGLRGLAILLVLLLHNFKFFKYFSYGWIGVDLFFVISGFLITGILIDNRETPKYLSIFYLRRVIRIFPLYYLLLTLCLFILPKINKLNFGSEYYQENQIFLWSYLQNWLFAIKSPEDDHTLLHTWSLAVEEQFYILWPIITHILGKPLRILLFSVLLLIGIGIARYLTYKLQVANSNYAIFVTFTRIDGLCIGAITSIIFRINPDIMWQNRKSIILFFTSINFCFIFLKWYHIIDLPYWALIGYTSLSVMFGLLVYATIDERSKLIRRIFGNIYMRFFGKISYSLYIFHWPIYLIIKSFTDHFILDSIDITVNKFILGIVSTIAAIIVSTISFEYFEKPILQMKSKFNYKIS